jgi:hypothetical protein
MKRLSAVAFAAPVILAGCAAPSADAPSLLPRPIEQISFDEPEVKPVPITPDPALNAKIAAAEKVLASAAEAFGAAAATAESLVAAAQGTAIGSDAWLDAQIALAALDNHRATSLATVSDLDQLAIARGVAGKPPYPALNALREKAAAQVQAESQRIGDLAGRIPPG